MILTLLLTDQEFELLRREAGRSGRVEEDLIEDVIQNYIATLPGYVKPRTPEERTRFKAISETVLRENAELYRRLAQS